MQEAAPSAAWRSRTVWRRHCAGHGAQLRNLRLCQADFIHDFQRVDPAWDDAFRPSKIPTIDGFFGGDGQSSISVKQSRFGVKGRCPTRTSLRSTSSSSSTCSASVSMRDRRRSGCATPTASGARCWPARPTACSWTATCSPTSSTTGARPAWCSTATSRSAGRRSRRTAATSPSRSSGPGNDVDAGPDPRGRSGDCSGAEHHRTTSSCPT